MTGHIVELGKGSRTSVLIVILLNKLSDSTKIHSNPRIFCGCRFRATITILFRFGFDVKLVTPARGQVVFAVCAFHI